MGAGSVLAKERGVAKTRYLLICTSALLFHFNKRKDWILNPSICFLHCIMNWGHVNAFSEKNILRNGKKEEDSASSCLIVGERDILFCAIQTKNALISWQVKRLNTIENPKFKLYNTTVE